MQRTLRILQMRTMRLIKYILSILTNHIILNSYILYIKTQSFPFIFLSFSKNNSDSNEKGQKLSFGKDLFFLNLPLF